MSSSPSFSDLVDQFIAKTAIYAIDSIINELISAKMLPPNFTISKFAKADMTNEIKRMGEAGVMGEELGLLNKGEILKLLKALSVGYILGYRQRSKEEYIR